MYSQTDIVQFKQGVLIEQKLLGHQLKFHTHYGVFSPKVIDNGTLLLLDYLDYKDGQIVLDLGCGYGVIGLSLAKACPNSQIYLVDKDFIAVNLSQKNAQLNNIDSAQAQLSDGFQHLEKLLRFDLIVSNMPAKVGKEQMAIFLSDAYHHLNIGGQLVVVTINGLKDYMKRNFKTVFGNYKKIKQSKDYIISKAIKT